MMKRPIHPLLDLREVLPELQFEIVYATAENVLGRPMYSEPIAWLHPDAVEKLRKVLAHLKSRWNYGVRIWDAFRPFEAQEMLWERFPLPGFVAKPVRGEQGELISGSNHSRGVALDATLFDLSTGRPLLMPSPFDDFSERASRHSTMSAEVRSRLDRMEEAFFENGFKGLESEWWHYDLLESAVFPLLR